MASLGTLVSSGVIIMKQLQQRIQVRIEHIKDLDAWALQVLSHSHPIMKKFIDQEQLTKGTSATATVVVPHFQFDKDSAAGIFTWVTVGEDKSLPVIYRNSELYVSVRMAEPVLRELFHLVPEELFNGTGIKLKSYHATTAEAMLLAHINTFHCDGFYGQEAFTVMDHVVKFDDFRALYEFLEFSFRVLHSGGVNMDREFKRCGFIKVDGEQIPIPFTVLEDGVKVIPLCFLQGGAKVLEGKTMTCTGLPMAYLKLCCVVIKLRKEHLHSPLKLVKLSDMKKVFRRNAVFNERWWPQPKGKSLLSEAHLKTIMESESGPTIIPSVKWTCVQSNNDDFKKGKNSAPAPSAASTSKA